MSENSPEVDGEDSDLKECLLEALRADGTLKQIQDQLSAAVYAAFYRKTAQTPVQAPSKLSSLTSEQTAVVLDQESDKDSYSENRKSQFQSQTSSGPIPSSDENVPSTNDPSLPVATSDAPTRNIVNRSTDFDQFIQPQMRQRDNEAYSNSHLSETDTNLHTAGPVFSTTYHRYTGSNDSPISPLHNHRFNDEIMYKPTSQIQQYDNGDESDGSDIDSEAITDVTLEPSKVEDRDFMKPVRDFRRRCP
ncbi:unnamed protein product [Hymenolepis diminuta]|uniref:Uncharacterized protein n=1 Tax=Hymenolepis diminuta TaxID=6216 RepID=A0A0R3STK5_HYMDI|nr:unnamed protein product [Hymenolepis diminuta]